MKKIFVFYLLVLISCSGEITRETRTYCNPLDLNYRFQFTDSASYREAADPTMIRYGDKYILFVSHSGGFRKVPRFTINCTIILGIY